jgi:hypothetical protein
LHIEKEDIMRNMLASQRWTAFALLVVAYFMTIVDFTIVNADSDDFSSPYRF